MTMSFQAASRAAAVYGMMGVAKSTLESLVRYLALELGEDGIRGNAISPGPVETLAGYGEIMAVGEDPECRRRLGGSLNEAFCQADEQFAGTAGPRGLEWVQVVAKNFQKTVASKCAIRETVSKEDVAGCALFLGSRLSTKITGQVIHVDCGLSSTLIL